MFERRPHVPVEVRPAPAGTLPAGGSGSVEAVGLILLLVLAVTATAGFLAMRNDEAPGRGLGQRIANRIACGPRTGDACRRHPLVPAYGWPLARAVRMLAPPVTLAGGLLPVDFRYCQRSTCALPGRRAGLTSANRRVTFFTETRPLPGGSHEITFWMYRPTSGWESHRALAGPGEVAAAAGLPLLLSDTPRLVPLEILPGRNHYQLPAGDEPPWRWRVKSRFPGRSA